MPRMAAGRRMTMVLAPDRTGKTAKKQSESPKTTPPEQENTPSSMIAARTSSK